MVAVRSGAREVELVGDVGVAGAPGRAAPSGACGRRPPVVGPWLAIVVVMASLLGGSLVDASPTGSHEEALPSLEPERAGLAAAVSSTAGAVHVVQPGESYWSIAVALGGDGGGDVRSLVADLEAANGSRPLQAGDRLPVPGAGG